jgi:GTP cyclohydrolase IA
MNKAAGLDIDKERIQHAVKEMIAAIGDDDSREGLAETPRRIAEMYAEVFEGINQNPVDVLGVTFDAGGHHEMIILKAIPFYSMCEHHFLPFHGVAHVGYIPKGRVAGVSKIARVVETLARRPQMQERLTSQVADTLMEGLSPVGVAVVIEAEHLCMTMRGVKKPGSRLVTSANRGSFRTNPATRAEFFSLVHKEE